MAFGVTLISAVPNFISPEEHKELSGSTPNSFSDIPPILRHKEENVTLVLTPALEGFQEAQGTLYILERFIRSISFEWSIMTSLQCYGHVVFYG